MLELFRQGGQWSWLLLVIAAVLAVLILLNVRRLGLARPEDASRIRYGNRAILFWGVIALALGFLGQFSGLYEGLTVLADAPEISTTRVAAGLAASCSTSILGMGVFLVSAVASMALSGWTRSVFASSPRHP